MKDQMSSKKDAGATDAAGPDRPLGVGHSAFTGVYPSMVCQALPWKSGIDSAT